MIGTTRRPLCSSAAVCSDFLFLNVLFLFLPMASYVKISFFVKGIWPQFRVPMQRRDENLRRQDTREYQNRGKDVSD